MSNQRLDLIRQALGAAESSIKLAKQLLNELEGLPATSPKPVSDADRPGVIGVYDGEKMVTEKGDTFPVPANYASKSLLVVGDTLKLYEENGEKRFKQIEHVKRHKTNGLLVKKEGKFRAITPEGSYKVLPEAVTHFKGDVGDEVVLHVPAGNMTSAYGAIESLSKKTKAEENNDESGMMNQELEEKVKAEVKKPVEVKVEEKKAEPAAKVVEKKEESVVTPIEVKAEPVTVKEEVPVKVEAPKAPEPTPAPKVEEKVEVAKAPEVKEVVKPATTQPALVPVVPTPAKVEPVPEVVKPAEVVVPLAQSTKEVAVIVSDEDELS